MADEKIVVYDDAVEQEKYLAKRKQQMAEDFAKPFDPEAVLEVRHLRKTFPIKKTLMGKVTKELVAVDDISFKLMPGETLGIVGESGCGKTTAGRAILKLHQPTGGQIIFDGHDITHLDSKQMRQFRKQMQIIFQDPYSSLDPRFTVKSIIEAPLENAGVPKAKRREMLPELMETVGG